MIDFLKYRLFYFSASFLLIVVGLYSILTNGFVFSIDFVGGGVVEFFAVKKTELKSIRIFIEKQKQNLVFQETSGGFLIRGKNLNKQSADKLVELLKNKYKLQKSRFEVVGPSIGSDNIQKTLFAVIVSVLGILLYIAATFKSWRFAVAAIIALLHDTIVLLGTWSVFGWLFGVEFDALFVTAILTTMSFSVHDTIVIFDKIKEESLQGRHKSLKENINWALSVTMSRSLNNSLTVVLMLVALVVLGGESVRWFALSLLVGTLLGTYSSPFVATPVFYLLSKQGWADASPTAVR